MSSVFGLPILIGKNYQRYPEAIQLINNGGMTSVRSAAEFATAYQRLITQEKMRIQQSLANQNFIKTQQGATKKIISFLKTQFNTWLCVIL